MIASRVILLLPEAADHLLIQQLQDEATVKLLTAVDFSRILLCCHHAEHTHSTLLPPAACCCHCDRDCYCCCRRSPQEQPLLSALSNCCCTSICPSFRLSQALALSSCCNASDRFKPASKHHNRFVCCCAAALPEAPGLTLRLQQGQDVTCRIVMGQQCRKQQ